MLTDFGKACRKIRIDANQILANMAEVLGVSPSFLSAVENGKKNVPNGWCETIRAKYCLSEDSYNQLFTAAENSQRQVKLELSKMSAEDRGLALSFARNFETLDDRKKEELRKLLIKE